MYLFRFSLSEFCQWRKTQIRQRKERYVILIFYTHNISFYLLFLLNLFFILIYNPGLYLLSNLLGIFLYFFLVRPHWQSHIEDLCSRLGVLFGGWYKQFFAKHIKNVLIWNLVLFITSQTKTLGGGKTRNPLDIFSPDSPDSIFSDTSSL